MSEIFQLRRCFITLVFFGCIVACWLWLTHWGRVKIAAISQTIISNTFSWMKMLEFRLKFHLSFFLRVQLTTYQHILVQIMAWRRPGDKLLSEPMMIRLPITNDRLLLMHMCATRPKWVNVIFTPSFTVTSTPLKCTTCGANGDVISGCRLDDLLFFCSPCSF